MRFRDEFMPADRAFARFGEAVPFFEMEAAVVAAGWRNRQLTPRMLEAVPDMLQMGINLFFRDPQLVGDLFGGVRSLFKECDDGAADRAFLQGRRRRRFRL